MQVARGARQSAASGASRPRRPAPPVGSGRRSGTRGEPVQERRREAESGAHRRGRSRTLPRLPDRGPLAARAVGRRQAEPAANCNAAGDGDHSDVPARALARFFRAGFSDLRRRACGRLHVSARRGHDRACDACRPDRGLAQRQLARCRARSRGATCCRHVRRGVGTGHPRRRGVRRGRDARSAARGNRAAPRAAARRARECPYGAAPLARSRRAPPRSGSLRDASTSP